MDGYAISGIIWAVCLLGIVAALGITYRRRQFRTKLFSLTELLKNYFQGGIPAHQLGGRTREIVGDHFIGSSQFHALAIAAFQSAVDVKLADTSHAEDHERKLLNLLASLKNEFGLPDRYLIEGWRTGRE
jgi:hypothetical protein